MSGTADLDDVIEVANDGVTVRKSFAAEEFPVPAIKFEIETEFDEPVSVHIVEEIPEDFPMDGVGFHPNYHSDRWSAFRDHRVEFSAEIPPDEPLVTVYGVRIDDPSEAIPFLTEPTIASTSVVSQADDDAVASSAESVVGRSGSIADTMIEDIIASDRDSPVRDLIAGTEAGSTAAGGGGAAVERGARADVGASDPATDDGVEPADSTAQPDEAGSTGSAESGAASLGSDLDASRSAGDDEPIAARLVAELQDGHVDEEVRRALEAAIGREYSGSELARIERLEQQMGRLMAYTETLEAFLDEHGTGEKLITEFRGKLADFEGEMQSLADELSTVRGEVDDNATDLERVSADVGRVDTSVGALEGSVRSMESTVEDAESTVSDVQAEVTEVSDAVAEVRTDVDDATTEIDEVRHGLDDARGELDDARGELDEVVDAVDDVQEQLDEIGDDVEALVKWRSELGSMFSG